MLIGAEEKRRLMERVGRDSIGPLGAVLKCAAGILVLVVIATGPWVFLSASGPTVTATAGEHTRPQAAPRPQDGMAAAARPRSE